MALNILVTEWASNDHSKTNMYALDYETDGEFGNGGEVWVYVRWW